MRVTRRIREIQFLEEFLEKNPDMDVESLRAVLSYNVGWNYTKTNEMLDTLERIKGVKRLVKQHSEPIEISETDTTNETRGRIL